jgi:hypothetical protein
MQGHAVDRHAAGWAITFMFAAQHSWPSCTELLYLRPIIDMACLQERLQLLRFCFYRRAAAWITCCMLHLPVRCCSLRLCKRVWRTPQPSCLLRADVHRPHEVVEGPAVHDHAGAPHATSATRVARHLHSSCNHRMCYRSPQTATSGPSSAFGVMQCLV